MSIYHEHITSKATRWLFLGLSLLFGGLFIWRQQTSGPGWLSVLLAFLCLVFLFYTLNYHRLDIYLGQEALKLSFGIFHWTIPVENIASVALDNLPALLRYGGAGIHFMNVRNRYRASFNLLEYPRVVIALKRKAGLVRDISFTTQHPEEVIRLILAAIRQ